MESRDRVLEQFLGVKVGRFPPPSSIDKFKIRDAIFLLPEVTNFLHKNQVSPLIRYYSYRRGLRRVGDADLSASDLTVREILNRIIRESEHKIWLVDRVGDKKESLTLDF